MEYLTLQDIPHRHYNPLHSQRMTSSHSTERPLGNMAAAVSLTILSSTLDDPPPLSRPSPSSTSSRTLSLPNPTQDSHTVPVDPEHDAHRAHHSLNNLLNPLSPDRNVGEDSSRSTERRPVEARHSSLSRPLITPHASIHFFKDGYTLEKDGEKEKYHPYRDGINAELRRLSKSNDLTSTQSHHMRSSPPIQPGEQHTYADKLPSFSEFVQGTTRQTTPPRTPNRRNGSADSSPRARPHFEDVAWQETKRRRVDTLGDIYSHVRPGASTEQPPSESRRMPAAMDPALNPHHSHHSSHSPQSLGPPMQHHRPSLSYPPPHAPAPPNAHSRHQSSPAPQGYPASQEHPVHQGYANSQGYSASHRQSVSQEHPAHPSYRQPSMHPAMSAQGSYAPPPPPSSASYDHRNSYYQEAPPAPGAYPYERHQDSYYNRPPYSGPPHPGYENSYNDIRFQQHVGLDHNAFNRKRRGNLPKEATNILKSWFTANRPSPYPSEDQKLELCQLTGLSLNQVSNWFINARRRQPQKEAREREGNGSETPA